MEPNVEEQPFQTVLPAALSDKRGSQVTEVRVEKVLKSKEKDVEALLASIDERDNQLMITATNKIKTTTKDHKTTKSTKSNSFERSQGRVKLNHSQKQLLMAQVTCQMRLSRHKLAIIDMGLELLTSALVSCACLWEKAAGLLSSCLLLVGFVLSLAAAVATAEFCPYLPMDLNHYTMVSSYEAIFKISCTIIYALSGIAVASAAMRSASGEAVGRAILWVFLLPIVPFANLLWIPATGNWRWNEYCTDRTASIVLAALDVIFVLLTIVVIRSEISSNDGTDSFLTKDELKIVRFETFKYYREHYAAKQGEETNKNPSSVLQPLVSRRQEEHKAHKA
ncbi:uncharacterized protein LOC111080820 [Drosophila obscura]|uniref:uncharacterized protein LOC111080820 n=1 Tax=Drosophila obscura TaxID=7282 RepID=UPI001BB12A91|nr:uncharacterized protein LOC111080820 [Drosophila obscura]